ncbi:MAG: Crp/Fnr family transcriptional regulator [Clostridiales bacterium]|jgi:CRP-like cAMP-binding protein|nr:Crp/Fnr family transcriptional regulator [Clostridiales bacterium]
MVEHIHVLKNCPLFKDIDNNDLESLLKCLSAVSKSFDKNQFVFMAGEPASSVGIVLAGTVTVIHEDFWGNRSILTRLGPGEIFAEAFSCADNDTLPVSVTASEKTQVLLVDCKKIITTCSSTCIFHTSLIKNLLVIMSKKNAQLTRKIEHLSRTTTREKLLSYLSFQAQQLGKSSFEIPFNRQELADYLSVDRSAMSTELGKMRDEGLLDFKRNHFKLYSHIEH